MFWAACGMEASGTLSERSRGKLPRIEKGVLRGMILRRITLRTVLAVIRKSPAARAAA